MAETGSVRARLAILELMRNGWLPVAFFAAAGVLWPAAGEFSARRDALRGTLKDGAVVLFGRTAGEVNDDRTGFPQQADFYYLSGWREPGAVLLLAPDADILFLPVPDPQREKYAGKMLNPADPAAPAATGFATVLPADRLEAELARLPESLGRIYTVGAAATERLRKLQQRRETASAATAIAHLRMVKSPAELDLIRRAAEATMAAHRAAWKRAAPGLYEYQVAATMVAAYQDLGCERSAYAPIVGSGPNALILHYWRNSRRMDRGELLLMDVGAECAGYAADITRTIPVGARFTRRQREIYEVVLGAEKAALAAVKPGVTIPELSKAARAYMDAHGGMGKYLIHGVSHHIGLEVHDAADLSVPLAENMVISMEPGIYIPEESIGIRIEDMVLVTKDGARLITADLPREVEQIERAIRK